MRRADGAVHVVGTAARNERPGLGAKGVIALEVIARAGIDPLPADVHLVFREGRRSRSHRGTISTTQEQRKLGKFCLFNSAKRDAIGLEPDNTCRCNAFQRMTSERVCYLGTFPHIVQFCPAPVGHGRSPTATDVYDKREASFRSWCAACSSGRRGSRTHASIRVWCCGSGRAPRDLLGTSNHRVDRARIKFYAGSRVQSASA